MSRVLAVGGGNWEYRIGLAQATGDDVGVTGWWHESLELCAQPDTIRLCEDTMKDLFMIPPACSVITAVLSKAEHPDAYPVTLIKDSKAQMGVTVLLAYKKKEPLYVSQYDRGNKKRASFQTENLAPGGGWWHPVICLIEQKRLLQSMIELGEVAYFRVEIDE